MNIKHALTALWIVVATALANANGQPYSPTQLQQAYGLSGLQASGSGQTIAIIVAGSYSNALSTLNTFSAGYNGAWTLPAMSSFGAGPVLAQLSETGSTSLPPASNADWASETAMDMEYVHAMAPQANIILYETYSENLVDYLNAVQTAANNPAVSVVTSSWQFPESDDGYDYVFTTPGTKGKNGVTFCASTGDLGDIDESPGNNGTNGCGYPAVSPNVVAVGGTSLYLTGSGTYNYETAWSWNSGRGASGGTSTQGEPKPSYQTNYGTTHPGNVLHTTTSRAIPDVSMDANPNTGVWIYDSGWYAYGGTSLASPCFAGLIADADGIRVANRFTSLDGPTQTLPALYSLSGDFHDITSGNISPTGNATYSATTGYDLATGLGSPIANQLVPDLANWGINSRWALATVGNWSTLGNWTDGVPSLTGGSAAINVPTTSQVKITLDEPVMLGSLLLGNSASPSAGYTLSGGGTNTLTFSKSGSASTITVTDGGHQINAPVVLDGNLLVAGSGTSPWVLSFGSAGGITDNGSGLSLTMSGSRGTLVLGGSNTYGGTTISAGTLQLGSGGASGSVSGGIVIGTGGALVLDRSDNLTFGNAVSGGGTLTKTGSDSVTLSNAAAFSGAIVVAQGQLVLSAVSSASSCTVGSGGTLNASNQTLNLQESLLVNNGTVSGTANVGYGATAEGTGSFGQVNVLQGGALVVSESASPAAAGLLLSAGSITGAGQLAMALAIDGADLVVPNRADQLALSGALSGTGSIAKLGAGTLVLSGTNNFQGGTTVLDGRLIVADSYSLANRTNLTVGSAAPFAAIAPETSHAFASSDDGRLAPVPEPATLALLTVAAILLVAVRRCLGHA